jgi:hypothetical protein
MFKKMMNFRMRSGIASVVFMVCLAWAGLNFNVPGEHEFIEVDAALENAIADSDGEKKWKQMHCTSGTGTYEICFYTGDGNSCSTWGETTRDC